MRKIALARSFIWPEKISHRTLVERAEKTNHGKPCQGHRTTLSKVGSHGHAAQSFLCASAVGFYPFDTLKPMTKPGRPVTAFWPPFANSGKSYGSPHKHRDKSGLLAIWGGIGRTGRRLGENAAYFQTGPRRARWVPASR